MIKLATSSGDRLNISLLLDGGDCAGCAGPMVPEGMRVQLERQGDIALDMGLCGNCVGEALAILLGRRHVQHGGTIEDLSDTSTLAAATADASPGSPTSTGDSSPRCACRAMAPLEEGLRCVNYRGGDRCALDQSELLPGAAASGEDHGCCPACETTSVTRHPNGVHECLAPDCGATWTGRRTTVD